MRYKVKVKNGYFDQWDPYNALDPIPMHTEVLATLYKHYRATISTRCHFQTGPLSARVAFGTGPVGTVNLKRKIYIKKICHMKI